MRTSIVAIVNGKGGCGKTATTSNLAVIWAHHGHRVLAVDLDAQGNLAIDLGLEDTDAGLGFSLATQGGTPVEPICQVRPGLDVVAGGARTDGLAAALGAQAHRNPTDAIRQVVDTLHQVARGYELVVIDTAPAGGLLEDAALVGADWIVVPTKPDDKSLLGLQRVSQRLAALHDQGLPTGQLAGVVLFAIPVAATRDPRPGPRRAPRRLRTPTRRLRDDHPRLRTRRHRPVPPRPRRHRIRPRRRPDDRDRGDHRAGFAAGAASLAGDYQALAHEILTRIHTRVDANPAG